MFPSYAELHCLTNFTFLRGASHAEELVQRAARLGYSALAITDECSLAGVVRAHVAAKETALKILIGTEVRLASPKSFLRSRREAGTQAQREHDARTQPPGVIELVLLAIDREGYGNLSELITRGRRRSRKGEYALGREDIDDGVPGCLALLIPGEEIDLEQARWLKARFAGRCWIAAELLLGPDDDARLAALEALSRDSGVPLVAAGDVHMHARARRALQDTLTAVRLKRPIAQCGRALHPNGERHLRSRERLARIYPPELLIETLNVAERCRFCLDELRYEYPEEIVPAGETPASWLRKLAEAGFRWRFGAELQTTPSPSAPPPCAPLRRDLKTFPSSHELGKAGSQTTPSPSAPTYHPGPAGHPSSTRRGVSEGSHTTPSPSAPPLLGKEGSFLFPSSLRRGAGVAGGVVQPPGWGGHFTASQQIDLDKARALVQHELALIAELRYEPYFLTVYDVVRFARAQGILCQGRGSAANSAVCYCLGITEVDPARMQMLFERFLSRERNEPPDIDVDFEHERREEVIQYIYAKYGRERAAIAATVISYRAKSAVRDLGKALGLDLAQVDRLAKNLALGNLAFGDARRAWPQRLHECGFDPDSPVIRRLIALVNVVIGFPRHLSQHVGGFVISRGPVSRLVPIENAAMPDRTIIQWDKDDLDALGLLKVDVLALGMLTAIRRALKLISEIRNQPFTISDVPPEDPGVYEMVGRADTIGVFQIESRAQQAMLPRMRPQRFYDLVIEVAIVRPGPIQGGMIHPYLRRRQGLEPVTYPSEAVKGVLERTLGVPIFQEQVMQLAVVAAGFTPGEADRLRRAMAAWRRRGGLEPFEQRLKDGMRERGYPEAFAQQIYQQILGFGEYGFPESHSASFALLVYVSCWLKCYEPAAFTCALLNSQPMGFYAPAQLVQDAQRHGVEMRPVDVLVSEWDCTLEPNSQTTPAPSAPPPCAPLRRDLKTFPSSHELGKAGSRTTPSPSAPPLLGKEGNRTTPPATPAPHDPGPSGHPSSMRRGASEGSGKLPSLTRRGGAEGDGVVLQPAIRLGLRMVKGLPKDAAERLIEVRTHLASHLTPHTSLTFESLALAAQLNRHDMNALAAAGALATITGHRREAAWAVTGIHPRPPVLERAPIAETMPRLNAPTEGDDLVADYVSLGLTLGRHPLALLRSRLARLRMATAAEIRQMPHGKLARAAGLVIGRQRPDTASGVIFVTLEDETGMVNVVVWRGVSESQRRALLASHLLAVHGVIERQGEVVHLVAGKLEDHSALLGRLVARSRDFH